MKRVVLFLLTNIAVMLVLSISASILGIDRFLTSNGLNMGMLLAFANLIGFGGSFVSLMMSKTMAVPMPLPMRWTAFCARTKNRAARTSAIGSAASSLKSCSAFWPAS